MNFNLRTSRWQGFEFFAFPSLRLGRKMNWAESLGFLPSRMAICVGAPVALQQSRTLRTGTSTIARSAIDFHPVIFKFLHHPTLTNHSGHSIREKADILNRDFVDFPFRY